MVDKQNAVEMIHLMLDAGGKQPVRFEFAQLVVLVEIAHADRGRSYDIRIVVGQ